MDKDINAAKRRSRKLLRSLIGEIDESLSSLQSARQLLSDLDKEIKASELLSTARCKAETKRAKQQQRNQYIMEEGPEVLRHYFMEAPAYMDVSESVRATDVKHVLQRCLDVDTVPNKVASELMYNTFGVMGKNGRSQFVQMHVVRLYPGVAWKAKPHTEERPEHVQSLMDEMTDLGLMW